MTQDSLPNVIRANSLRLMVVSALLLATFGGLVIRFGPSIVRSVRGPLQLSGEELVRRMDAHDLDGELVEVTAPAAADSGLHHQFDKDGRETTGASITILVLDGRVVPVWTPEPTDSRHFVGIVEPIDATVAHKVDARVQLETGKEPATPTFAIDATVDHVLRGRIAAPFLTLGLALSVVMFVVNLLAFLAPSTARPLRRLRRRYGRDAVEMASRRPTCTSVGSTCRVDGWWASRPTTGSSPGR
jgi:hypothetical protein